MTRGWRTGVLWLVLVAGATGCAGVRASAPPPSMSQRLDQADVLVRGGRYVEGRAAYAAILSSGAGADEALLGLARLALDPLNPERDRRQAATHLDRLIAGYPRSAGIAEALTWRSLLATIDRLQGDVRRHQQELDRLGRELRREQQETVRLRYERERLMQIDVEYERPQSSQMTPSDPSPVRLRE